MRLRRLTELPAYLSFSGVLFPVTTNMWLYAIMNATFGALQTNLYIGTVEAMCVRAHGGGFNVCLTPRPSPSSTQLWPMLPT